MLEAIDPDLKVLIFRIVGPLYLIGFAFLARFVAKRLPPRCLSGWKVMSTGVLVAALGIVIAVYFSSIASIAIGVGGAVGSLLVVIGMIKFFVAAIINRGNTG